MGCNKSRQRQAGSAYGGLHDSGSGTFSSRAVPDTLTPPAEDVLLSAIAFDDNHFATCGIDGWVYFYAWQIGKSTNRLYSLGGRCLLTASTDATVRLWSGSSDDSESGLPAAATVLDTSVTKRPSSGSGERDACTPEPALSFEGHRMSVTAMELIGVNGFCRGGSGGGSVDEEGAPSGGDCAGGRLFTGSRDCTLRLWDLETAAELQQAKILRNVVTALRRFPGSATRVVAQASEDLQLRLWDTKMALRQPAHAVHGGPNQLICIDVTDDGNYVICGSKGFSRENCVVKIFDVRGGLREISSTPVADQTVEALRIIGPDRCIVACKDGMVRGLSVSNSGTDVSVVSEHSSVTGAYTALGTLRRPAAGPVAFAASAGPEGLQLEIVAWQSGDFFGPPSVLATSPR
eukprot:TRINITY_DN12719_c0_g1_i2.p1 TRINITY_DN12719_c0_g1~~TRINITY_DN12719_c0_g1_i2.p1  ORF type:complete len:404 (-),score=57.84 TRINITY_DN12719_c0_g1_i2:44-1255(-)